MAGLKPLLRIHSNWACEVAASDPMSATATTSADAVAAGIADRRRTIVDRGGGRDHARKFGLVRRSHHHEARQVLRLAAGGTALGMLAGWMASRWLASLVFGVSARSGATMAAS